MAGKQQDDLYYAVIIPLSDDPILEIVESVDELVVTLKRYYGTKANAYVFKGRQWFISKGPVQRHLLSPTGEKFALFQTENISEPDPEGSLYTRNTQS